jgi:Tfp pilus assembly protein FimT
VKFPSTSKPTHRRAAMTLVELLVVVAIVVIVIAIMVPAMRPAVEGRKVREASRQINAFMASAKAKAAESNRPVGVFIQAATDGDGNTNGYALEIGMAEVPLPYAGDSYNSRATAVSDYSVDLTFSNAGLASGLVKAGDLIRFNSQEPMYEITGVSGSTVTFQNRPGRSVLPTPPKLDPDPRVGGLFQVYRAPVKAGTKTVQLPRGAVIDMQHCGTGGGSWGTSGNWNAIASQPVILLFSPTGRVERLSVAGTSSRMTDTLYLLVGEAGIGSDPQVPTNLANGNSRWIAINALNGHVTTSPNVPSKIDGTPTTTVTWARQIASESISSGGKK